MKRFLRYGQKGFTLIELLIVIAVLGALAAVVVPQVGKFLGTANLTAGNTEAANVKTGAMSYLADKGGFPDDSDDLIPGYISNDPSGLYTFDDNGQVESALACDAVGNDSPDDGITKGRTWNKTKQSWE